MKRKDTVVRARIDANLKAQATQVLAECGLELSGAIRLFLQQVVVREAVPFPIETIRRVEHRTPDELWDMKAGAQARDQAPAHAARADLTGENRLLVRPGLLRGAYVRNWSSGNRR